jgi:DNA-binding transcriptional LysR family regulator
MAAPKQRFYYKGDRLKPLRAFCQVARLGSVSRAAEALFLSQPAVTLQLQALERDMGAPLFERIGRRLTLTRGGTALYELARPLVEGVDGLEGEFRNRLKGLEGGDLHVAAGSSTILYLLPPLVKAFRESHPAVQLVLHNVTGKDGLSLLRSDTVDLAVGSMLDVPTDLSYEPIYSFDPMLIMPKGHPLADRVKLQLEDLSPFGLILPPKRLTTWRLVDLVFQQRRVPYTVALEVGGWEIIKQYVAMGLGISIVTGICLTEADHERLEVRNLSEYFPPRSYGVVVRKGKFLSPHARAFADLVKPGLFERRDHSEPGHSER